MGMVAAMRFVSSGRHAAPAALGLTLGAHAFGSPPPLQRLACHGFLWNIKSHGALVDRLVVRINQSISTLCGPGGRPRRMIGVPLASAQCHGASSTVT